MSLLRLVSLSCRGRYLALAIPISCFSGERPAHGHGVVHEIIHGPLHPGHFLLVPLIAEEEGVKVSVPGMGQDGNLDAVPLAHLQHLFNGRSQKAHRNGGILDDTRGPYPGAMAPKAARRATHQAVRFPSPTGRREHPGLPDSCRIRPRRRPVFPRFPALRPRRSAEPPAPASRGRPRWAKSSRALMMVLSMSSRVAGTMPASMILATVLPASSRFGCRWPGGSAWFSVWAGGGQ